MPAPAPAPVQFTLSGIVLDQGTKERLIGATVRMETSTDVLFQETDEDGKFAFKDIAEPDLKDQISCKVLLFAYSKDGRQQNSAPSLIEVEKGKAPKEVVIKMVNRGPISNRAGIAFLAILLMLLAGLAYSYYSLHKPDVNDEQQEFNPGMVNILSNSLVDRITDDSIKVSNFKLKDDLIDSADQVFITAELQQLEGAVTELFKSSLVDSGFMALVYRNLEDAKRDAAANNKEGIMDALVKSKSHIKRVPTLAPSWFWETTPYAYYEILFWALFATLLRLINNTGYYVSRNTFFRDSILQKVALLFSIPLIALLITFVISFFKINISIGGTELSIDFSNPYVSIILASLIGLAPWKSWEFMYGLADKLFVVLKRWLGLEKDGNGGSVEDEVDASSQNQDVVVETDN